MQSSFHFAADLCYHYNNLSEANRNRIHQTPLSGQVLCDIQLPAGWYRFVGTAGTKMPAMRVPAFRCGTDWLGWLVGTDPAMEDGEVHRTVCFSNFNYGCKYSESIKERMKNKNKNKNNKQKTENERKKSEIAIFWTSRSPCSWHDH